MPLEGMQIGRYRLLRMVGSGGMGEVYLAEDPTIRRQVAIKIIRVETPSSTERGSDSGGIHLFLREARAIAQLDHPHILPLFDYGEERVQGMTLAFLVMPFRPTGSLTQWMEQRGDTSLLSLEELMSIVNQAADALQYAHNHDIIHQDVKPSNFLIRNTADIAGNTPAGLDVILADFGVAKISTATTTNSQGTRGTPRYMAPEQWNGDAVPASDQYALAVMTYELLTGRSPFTGTALQLMYQHLHTPPSPPSILNPRLSSTIDQVILRALAKHPADRFPSITAFAQALRQALQDASAEETPAANLEATLSISKEEAQKGTTRTLTLPGGRRITISIPANARDGQVLLLDGPADPTSHEEQGLLRLTLSIQETQALPLTPGESNLIKTTLVHSTEAEVNTPAQNRDESTFIQPGAEPDSVSDVSTRVISNSTPVSISNMSTIVSSNPPPVTPVANAVPASVPQPPRRNQRKTIWLIASVLVVVIVGASILAFSLIKPRTQQHPGAASTPSHGKSTAIAHSTPSPTPTPNLTATIAAANPNPYPPYTGSLTLLEPLTNNLIDWDNSPMNTSGSACQFSSDGYHILQVQQNIDSCLNMLQPANFAFEVQMHITRGDCGGIIFRGDISSSKDYTFEVCQDGSYNLYLNLGSSTTTLLSQSSASIHLGYSTTNTIAVVAIGNSLKFYVNHTNIASITDSTYGKGYFGMIAEDMNTATEVIYNNARLWTI